MPIYSCRQSIVVPIEDSHATSGAFMQKHNAKIVSARLFQKQVKRPDFQGFLHGEPQRKPMNAGARRLILSQPSNPGLKPRAL